MQAFLREEDLQRRLRTETDASDAEVWHDFRLFIAWNRLSQIFSQGLTEAWLSKVPTVTDPESVRITTRRVDALTVALDPYPFASSPQYFPVKTYPVPDRPYASARDLLVTLSTTPTMSAMYHAIPDARRV